MSNPPHSNSLLFPLKQRPQFSYKQGPRAFGSNRSGGRKHAGCDLYATSGTDIRAIADGTVTAIYYFYLGTKAIEVDHGKYHVRYGEVRGEATALKVGSKVKRGETIAKVGTLKFKSGKTMSMLHIEFYNKSSFGALTVRSNLPYKRRSDLINPTSILDSATLT